jgi:hypothetical protein
MHLLLLAGAVIGCGKQSRGEEFPESNLRLVAVMYSQYVSAHGGEAPADAADFRAYVQSLGPGVLQRAGLSSVDDLFVSRRNGKPFAIKYKRGDWKFEGAIAYEQESSDGTHYVATDLGGVSEITEAQFQKRVTAAK